MLVGGGEIGVLMGEDLEALSVVYTSELEVSSRSESYRLIAKEDGNLNVHTYVHVCVCMIPCPLATC